MSYLRRDRAFSNILRFLYCQKERVEKKGAGDNKSIKNKFGLGAGAEAWDNSSYSDDGEEEEDGDSYR